MLRWGKTTRKDRRKTSDGRSRSPRRGLGRFELLESRRMLDSGVVFNEIMYHPTGDGASLEWVELHNQLAIDVDVSDWSIRGGIDYVFPEGTFVPGGGYLVVAASPDDLAAAGGPADVLGPFAGRLANEGERLELVNNSDRLMNVVEYGDAAPWPVEPDGSGTSLAKLDPDADSEPAEHWASSVLVGGTPGRVNFPDGSEPAELVTLVAIDATWAYDQSGSDLGTAWRGTTYDDSAWPAGAALLYVESASLPGPKNTPLALGITTYYFRTEFDLPADSVAALRLRHVIDDGAVFYLNGIEICRFNLPAGKITSTTTAYPYVADATLSGYITVPVGRLQPGTNVLAAEVHQQGGTNTDVVMGAELSAEVVPPAVPEVDEGLVFNEVAAAGSAAFWLELANVSDGSIDLAGYVIRSSAGDECVLPSGSIEPGELVAVTAAQLGFSPAEGDKLFLAAPDGMAVLDAVAVADALQGQSPEFPGRWLAPDSATPGTANVFTFHDEVVINEIMYHHRALWTPEYAESDEEWIELYNRDTLPVDLSGWTLEDAVGAVPASNSPTPWPTTPRPKPGLPATRPTTPHGRPTPTAARPLRVWAPTGSGRSSSSACSMRARCSWTTSTSSRTPTAPPPSYCRTARSSRARPLGDSSATTATAK
ncbi:MAG: lamin tail domain-containing protein [Planctomycetia bacterium]|nr:lamin tail domain-containing protein [Planctomycetia bacterium]